MAELILGFDLRCDPNAHDPYWTSLRRQQLLLREDLRPLSVDESVWLRPNSRVVPGKGLTVETPKYSSLADAIVAMADGCWAIAISGWEGEKVCEAASGAVLSHPSSEWQRLGWDVVDGFFPSGLTNCGLAALERETLAARWSQYLNSWHLFDDLSAAREFREDINARVPEHAPFCVMGLYRV